MFDPATIAVLNEKAEAEYWRRKGVEPPKPTIKEEDLNDYDRRFLGGLKISL